MASSKKTKDRDWGPLDCPQEGRNKRGADGEGEGVCRTSRHGQVKSRGRFVASVGKRQDLAVLVPRQPAVAWRVLPDAPSRRLSDRAPLRVFWAR